MPSFHPFGVTRVNYVYQLGKPSVILVQSSLFFHMKEGLACDKSQKAFQRIQEESMVF